MAVSDDDFIVEDDYDTDTISVTSTATGNGVEDPMYDVEDILAERVNEYGEKNYLVKWDDYPLDEYVMSNPIFNPRLLIFD